MRRLMGAMSLLERQQEVISNNVANATTGGYKQQRVFAQLLNGAIPVVGARTDFSPGAVSPTGNPLDVALDGDGFLVVATPQGERLSRGGSFRLDEEARLVDAAGNPVLLEPGVGQTGRDGMLRIPENSGPVRLARDGSLYMGDPNARLTGSAASDVLLGRLRVVGVTDPTALAHEAGTVFRALPGATQPLPDPDRRIVRQGFLEASNVNAVSAMTEMITVQRRYADTAKAATTLDEVRGILTNLAKP